MNWGKRKECEISVKNSFQCRFILRQGSIYIAILSFKMRLVWNSDKEGKTLLSF